MNTWKLLCVISLVILWSCGKRPFILEIDPALQEYVTRFETVGGTKIYDLKAKFGTIIVPGQNIVGLCSTVDVSIKDNDGIPPPMVTIDRNYWDSISDLEKEELMFHELGHCVLYRQHRNDVGSDGCPLSIMNWQTLSLYCLQNHGTSYHNELFGR